MRCMVDEYMCACRPTDADTYISCVQNMDPDSSRYLCIDNSTYIYLDYIQICICVYS